MADIFIAQLNYNTKNVHGNFEKILAGYEKASSSGASVMLLSRCAMSGYLDRAPVLLGEFVALCRKYIEDLALHTLHKETCIIIGSVEQKDAQPCEVIYLLSNGTVQTLMHIPKYLCDTQSCTTFRVNGLEAALLIEGNSEDVTISSGVDLLILMGQSIHGWPDVLSYCMKLSGKFGAQLAYVNLLGGYESQVFPGGSLVCDDAKVCLCALWSEEQNVMHPHVARNDIGEPPISEERDYQNLMLALRDYTHKNGFAGVTLGMSGGIDSALVAAIAADALGPQYVHTFMLPTRYTTPSSVKDAEKCALNLGANHAVVSIEGIYGAALEVLHALPGSRASGVAEENMQARIRGMSLMAASNKMGLLLLATGNKSESLAGYMTLYGDTCGGFAPIKDVYKTRVYELTEWRNSNIPRGSLCQKMNVIPEEIIRKAPSAELRPDQKDQDTLPEYSDLDSVLHALVDVGQTQEEAIRSGLSRDLVESVVNLVQKSSFKLQQVPCGPAISRPYSENTSKK